MKRQGLGLVLVFVQNTHSNISYDTYNGQVGLGVLGMLFGLAVGTNV